MGQCWLLFNLDKMESMYLPAAKMGEFFHANNNKHYVNTFLSDQPDHKIWAGDRIILIGDCAESLPAGVVTSEDSVLLQECSTTNEVYRVYDLLSSRSSTLYKVNNITKGFPAETIYILRNLTKKEYVRSDAMARDKAYPAHRVRAPGLTQALFTLVGWSDDPSCALYYNTDAYRPTDGGSKTPLHRGPWAGNRLDAVVFSDEVQQTLKDDQWKDISTETARYVSDVYTSVDQQETDIIAHFEAMARQQSRLQCCTQ